MENMKIRTYGSTQMAVMVQEELLRIGCYWLDGVKGIRECKGIYGIDVREGIIMFDRYQGNFDNVGRKEVTLYDLQQMETPVVFEVKEDCACYETEAGLKICSKKRELEKVFILRDDTYSTTCHNCPDYEKKKESDDIADSLIYALKNNKIVINTDTTKLMEELRNFNCPDYEKEKKLVKLFICVDKDTKELYAEKFEGWADGKNYVSYAKVCPETHRIYIEVEEN
jgi:hypothetical protein